MRCGSITTFLLRGRRSVWWGWREIPVAPRIVNDVSYVSMNNTVIPFAWQAQSLVRLQGDACCFAHCKWRFICEYIGLIMKVLLRGRRTIWWGCRVIPLARRIVNDLSCCLAPLHIIQRSSTSTRSIWYQCGFRFCASSITCVFVLVQGSTGVVLCSTE